MQTFTKPLLAIAACMMMPVCMHGAYGVTGYSHDLRTYAWQGAQEGLFKTRRDRQVAAVNAMLNRAAAPATRAEGETFSPAVTLPSSELMGDLDGPDGRLWYYTASFEFDYVEVSEYFTDRIMKEYAFEIYDADLKHVGTIRDKVNYKEGETRVPLCELAPVVTRNFFNSDSNPEIVVGLTVNTEKNVNMNYSIVYSLGGEKKDGYDVPVTVIDMMIGDVLNASTPEEENYYLTFMYDDNAEVPEKDYSNLDPDDPDKMGFWEHLLSYGMGLVTYGKAGADGQLSKLWEKRMRLCDMPGNQQDSPFMISFMQGGKPYFLYTHLTDSFFAPYYDPFSESEMREGNNLVMEVMTPENGAMKTVQTTTVPTRLHRDIDDMVICSYYSTGSMGYRDDIMYNESTGKFDFVLLQQHELSGTETLINNYYVYDHEGNAKLTLFEKAQSCLPVSDVEGKDPQANFVTVDGYGDYIFNFVNLKTGQTEFSTNYRFEIDEYSDPERITSNLDRIKVGDRVLYAVELRTPGQDENSNDIMRILWFDDKGKFERIDEVMMGQGVYYAQAYISQGALRPDLFNTDAAYEYMVLVKRGYDIEGKEMKKEELIVGQPMSAGNPDGKTLLHLQPEERGDLNHISLYTDTDKPVLFVTYKDGDKGWYTQDYYWLPLGSDAGVETLPETACGIRFDGVTVWSEGKAVTLYDMRGAAVARGTGSVSTAGIAKGMYIAVSGTEAIKVNVR